MPNSDLTVRPLSSGSVASQPEAPAKARSRSAVSQQDKIPTESLHEPFAPAAVPERLSPSPAPSFPKAWQNLAGKCRASPRPAAHEESQSRAASTAGAARVAYQPSSVAAVGEIAELRQEGGSQIMRLNYYPDGKQDGESPQHYEVVFPVGSAGVLDMTAHSNLADALTKLIQVAENEAKKEGKTLSSMTFSKPERINGTPIFVISFANTDKQVVVDSSQDPKARLPFLEQPLQTELKRIFALLNASLHLPTADKDAFRIRRLDDKELLTK